MRHFTRHETRQGNVVYDDRPTQMMYADRSAPVMSDAEMDSRRSRSVTVERRPWSPAQIVAIVGGVIFLVIGGIALARTGVSGPSITATHVEVAGAGQTELMAILELIFGALLLAAGSIPGAGRGGMTFLGLVSLVFGIVVAAQASSFTPKLGIGSGYGVFLIVVGLILALTAMIAPVYWGVDRRWGASRRHEVR